MLGLGVVCIFLFNLFVFSLDSLYFLFMFAPYLLNNLLKYTDMTLQEFNHRMFSFNDSLMFYSKSLTSNNDDAKDLLQDTYLKALKNKDKFDPSTNMKAWTHVIMKNTFINNYRKSLRDNTVIDNTQDLYYLNNSQKDSGINPEHEYSYNDILNKLEGLDDDFNIPFLMNIQGYKYKEIAEEMDLPIGTVKSRIFLTRKKLMGQLSEYHN